MVNTVCVSFLLIFYMISGVMPSEFDCLCTVSHLSFQPESSHFFYNLSYSTIVYELAGYSLLHKMSCRQEHVF